MSVAIHPTAIIESGAQLDTEVEVGPYAYVGSEVKISRGTIVHHHATVDGNTELGENNEVYPYAFIGAKPHDLKYTGGSPGLRIGSNNLFREYVTIHIATKDGDLTTLEDHNLFLAYSHVAHDCKVGSRLIMSSHSALGGHVEVHDHVNIGWGAGVHQFCKLGDYAMAAACSKVVQDIPPFMIADGSPASVRTINKVGLQRAGFSAEDLDVIRTAFKVFYKQGLNRSQAIDALKQIPHADSEVLKNILIFADKSQRGWA